MRKAYIAGKITGNDNYKTEFKEAESKLSNEGYSVMNPSTLNEGFEQMDYLHICSAMIDICDSVHFLPNWTASKGAHFEMGYALAKNKEILFL